MSADSGKELFRLGFLTAVEIPERGFVGGLLVTNQFGRPLEFQCTAPLRPNRTQEILYGPTLVPYVLGDLIGRTLIEKVAVKPHLVLTERDDLLSLRNVVSIPVAFIEELPGKQPAPLLEEVRESSETPLACAEPPLEVIASESSSLESVAAQHATVNDDLPAPMKLGRQLLRFHSGHAGDRQAAEEGAGVVPHDADLREPFDRIREALNETAGAGSGGAR